MRIIQLPDSLANKIAAGEVVERPASVVKELIENSIDAESTSIAVDVKEAGIESIKIIDDGVGMEEVDVERAFLRHATSKIRNENDLFHVRTLGFRGEALASIASVSRLHIKTSTGEKAGTSLSLEGGRVTNKSKSDARRGTEIAVHDLFYNTPARLKYMKTIHTELGHITEVLYRSALAHPEIRFEVTHNEKSLFKTSGNGDLLQVIANIYGMGVASKMLQIKGGSLDFSVAGFIAKPEVTRASRGYMSVLINGRYIKSVAINQAILRGYHTFLPINRFPLTVLSIEMDPILLDVNVHPTKLEVRFSKEKELVDFIEETVRNTFRKATLIPEVAKPKIKKPAPTHQPSFTFNQVERTDHSTERKVFNTEPLMQKESKPIYKAIEEDLNQLIDQKISSSNELVTLNERDTVSEEEHLNQEQRQDRIPDLYPIGQLQGTYIMAQNEKGLYMIDQHAAQERIKYEFFREKLSKPTNELQQLLIPLTFELTNPEAHLIIETKDELERVGLFFEPFGQRTFIIRSHPNWFPNGFEEETIREMIDYILQEKVMEVGKIREEAAILMSCKRSIKANHYLNHDDMLQLLNDLRATTDPFTCPHGRPIIVHFSTYEIEKMFKRIM